MNYIGFKIGSTTFKSSYFWPHDFRPLHYSLSLTKHHCHHFFSPFQLLNDYHWLVYYSIKPVYSARYAPSEIPNQAPSTHKSKSKRGDSFADFDSSTSDAWEVNDDELLALSSAQKLSLERNSSGESSNEGEGSSNRGVGVGGAPSSSSQQDKSVPYIQQGKILD